MLTCFAKPAGAQSFAKRRSIRRKSASSSLRLSGSALTKGAASLARHERRHLRFKARRREPATRQFFNGVLGMMDGIRTAAGRPATAFGISPIAIYRAVRKHA